MYNLETVRQIVRNMEAEAEVAAQLGPCACSPVPLCSGCADGVRCGPQHRDALHARTGWSGRCWAGLLCEVPA